MGVDTIQHHGASKVADFTVAVSIHEDIFRLEVRVRQSNLVDLRKRQEDLVYELLYVRHEEAPVPILLQDVVETRPERLEDQTIQRTYVFKKNVYSNFWLIFGKLERLVLGCIEAEFRK